MNDVDRRLAVPDLQGVRPSLVQLTHLIYGLHACAVIVGVSSSVATVAGGFVFGLPSLLAVLYPDCCLVADPSARPVGWLSCAARLDCAGRRASGRLSREARQLHPHVTTRLMVDCNDQIERDGAENGEQDAAQVAHEEGAAEDEDISRHLQFAGSPATCVL